MLLLDKSIMQSWENTIIHFIDFEGSKASGVVEYGIATFQNYTITNTYTRLCAPVRAIPPIEYGIHKIKTDLANSFPPFSQDFALFKKLRKTGSFAAHNAAAENALIKEVWPYAGKTFFFFPSKHSIEWGPWIDTLFIYQNLFPAVQNFKLMGLVRYFGLENALQTLVNIHCPKNRQKPHCALHDALASAILFKHLAQLEQFRHLLPQHFLFLSTPNSRLRWHEYFQAPLPILS